ncbi:hypothetical protein H696_01155 [Fonticula alba]|uniref:Poly(A) RNA polymerase mitochondrial-like central palm domain-containing protein n=1 Tax=Fonticula alba TaxID=691883 RepID=A0A058ZBF6_FONAL|nr:hypothetical protein H696_01155 [Fonticula alba]KCV71734.1 hypothetical protein H696_01155 [Fonticula alba]|eukprot:XP_009493312.1 hypothetical protein H696_01155 [Fonticula alba]
MLCLRQVRWSGQGLRGHVLTPALCSARRVLFSSSSESPQDEPTITRNGPPAFFLGKELAHTFAPPPEKPARYTLRGPFLGQPYDSLLPDDPCPAPCPEGHLQSQTNSIALGEYLTKMSSQNLSDLHSIMDRIQTSLFECSLEYNSQLLLDVSGSFVSSLASPTSDIDLCVLVASRGEKAFPGWWIQPASGLLRGHPMQRYNHDLTTIMETMRFKHQQFIAQTSTLPIPEKPFDLEQLHILEPFLRKCGIFIVEHRVSSFPMIKLIDTQTQRKIDLGFSDILPVINSRLINSLMCLDRRFHLTTQLVREWASRRDLAGATRARLSSYALTLMVYNIFRLYPGEGYADMETQSVGRYQPTRERPLPDLIYASCPGEQAGQSTPRPLPMSSMYLPPSPADGQGVSDTSTCPLMPDLFQVGATLVNLENQLKVPQSTLVAMNLRLPYWIRMSLVQAHSGEYDATFLKDRVCLIFAWMTPPPPRSALEGLPQVSSELLRRIAEEEAEEARLSHDLRIRRRLMKLYMRTLVFGDWRPSQWTTHFSKSGFHVDGQRDDEASQDDVTPLLWRFFHFYRHAQLHRLSFLTSPLTSTPVLTVPSLYEASGSADLHELIAHTFNIHSRSSIHPRPLSQASLEETLGQDDSTPYDLSLLREFIVDRNADLMILQDPFVKRRNVTMHFRASTFNLFRYECERALRILGDDSPEALQKVKYLPFERSCSTQPIATSFRLARLLLDTTAEANQPTPSVTINPSMREWKFSPPRSAILQNLRRSRERINLQAFEKSRLSPLN